MSTIFTKGDLFNDPSLDAVAHGCNCAGAMGAGIALEFKRSFPAMYIEYKKLCKAGTFKLGDVFIWDKEKPVVFNLGTQKTWGKCANLFAIELAMAKMLLLAEMRSMERVGVPRIGAGLGGLDWPAVKKVFVEVGKKVFVDLVVFETFVPAAEEN